MFYDKDSFLPFIDDGDDLTGEEEIEGKTPEEEEEPEESESDW